MTEPTETQRSSHTAESDEQKGVGVRVGATPEPLTGGKSLGQIAHEARGGLNAGAMEFARPIPWEKLPRWASEECERMAEAVRAALRAPEPLTDEIDKFESWALTTGYAITRDFRGDYRDQRTRDAWAGFRSAVTECYGVALRAPEPLTASSCWLNNPEANCWQQGRESGYGAALEGGVSPQPSSSVHLTESAGESVQRPAGATSGEIDQ